MCKKWLGVSRRGLETHGSASRAWSPAGEPVWSQGPQRGGPDPGQGWEGHFGDRDDGGEMKRGATGLGELEVCGVSRIVWTRGWHGAHPLLVWAPARVVVCQPF